MTSLLESIKNIDDQLSNRYIDLDPGGYWIIYIDPPKQLIGLKHYSNNINEKGLAVDPVTGEVIPCKGAVERQPTLTLEGQTAKELCVQLFEKRPDCPITMLNHAAYLGRELVRAELALIQGNEYIQD